MSSRLPPRVARAAHTPSLVCFATVIADKLESRGLVTRTPHPEGNRRKLVTLTDADRR